MNAEMNIWSLIAEATLVVQLVMAVLLLASIASWVIIFSRRATLAGWKSAPSSSRNASGPAPI